MNVLDLFAGLGGWGSAFRDRGHLVYSLDIEPDFGADFCCDIREAPLDDLVQLGPWDGILASPPCEKFSVLRIGHNWTPEHQPRNEGAAEAVEIVQATLDLIEALAPRWFVIENPRAKLRSLPTMQHLERRTVTYCQYGEPFQKPTDLWGGFPEGLVLFPPCKAGDPCHTPAPRGSRTGIQGELTKYRGDSPERAKLSAIRAKIPYKLSEAVCLAAEGTPPLVPTVVPGDPRQGTLF